MTSPDEASAAVSHVREGAKRVRRDAWERISDALDRTHGLPKEPAELSSISRAVRERARLTINFHPDRNGRDGRIVAAGLAKNGRYRPQLETGISNGGRTAVPGGARMDWERQLFGGAYGGGAEVRPVYGALDLTADVHGASPRFGSSYLVLAEHCFDRATFCVGDSHLGPADVGTADEFLSIVAGLAEGAAGGDGLGRGLSGSELLRLLREGPQVPTVARALDDYVEAQIHGPLLLGEDVIALVLDPSFKGTEVESLAGDAAASHGFELRWHPGSRLVPAEVPDRFRGPGIKALAAETAGPVGWVDAAAIGRALGHHPFVEPQASGDPESSPLQRYKKLWHCVLAFGHPAAPRAGS